MDVLKRYPLASALAILAGVLVLVIGLEYGSSAALHEKVASAGGAPVPVQTALLPAIAAVNPDQEYAETGARPLFTPTRRPAPAAPQVAASTMAKGQFLLTGVISAGGTKIALLREKSSGRIVRVEQGKDVNGITVAQIDPEQVTLAQGSDHEVVQLLVAKGAAQPAAPPPVPSAPGVEAPGPFAAPALPAAAQPTQPNPAARPPVAQPVPGQAGVPPTPAVNPGSLFGPRPGGLTPGNSSVPVADPNTAGQAPLTPEELLARRRARRTQQSQ